MEEYTVYVQINEGACVVAVNSSAFLTQTEGWVEVDRGTGDRYHHAQGNYFPQPIYTADGIHRYKLEDGQAMERSEEAIAADRAVLTEPQPTAEERMDNVERTVERGASL